MTVTSPTPNVLKLKRESKLWRLLPGYDADSELEASGVLARDGWYYIVFDNHSTIACISARLDNAQDNRIAGRLCTDHGFEDITYNDGLKRYYTLVETRRHPCGDFCPQIEEYTPGFEYIETCWVNVPFQTKNKGMEGIVYLARNNSDYVLGLCEGNHCGEDDDVPKEGGGRIRVLHKQNGAWESIAKIKLPKSLRFADYASLALRGDRLAVLSQKSAQLWIGRLAPDRWEIVDEGVLYTFSEDKKAYCNLEGIAWLDDTSFVVVSDRAKEKNGKCAKRDQSIHIFELPP
jgi:hypothetical protein